MKRILISRGTALKVVGVAAAVAGAVALGLARRACRSAAAAVGVGNAAAPPAPRPSLAVVWILPVRCLLLDRSTGVVWRLSGGCLAVVW